MRLLSLSNTHFGWMVTGGLEYAVTSHFVARGELRYAWYEAKMYNARSIGGDGGAVMLGGSYRW
jgi:opacity protein-like surface antigen